jgi:chromosome segregation ATPase
MAFTRKMLKALGIDDEKIEQIMDAHTEVTESLKQERDAAKAAADELTKVKDELEQAKQSLKDADKNGKDLQSKYDTEHAEFEKLKNEVTAKATKEKTDKALIEWAKSKGYSEAGAKKIAKYGGYGERIKFDEDGKPTNLDELENDVAAEWGEYKGETKTDTHKETNPMAGGTAPKQSLAAKYYAEYNDRLYGTKTAADSGDKSNKEG